MLKASSRFERALGTTCASVCAGLLLSVLVGCGAFSSPPVPSDDSAPTTEPSRPTREVTTTPDGCYWAESEFQDLPWRSPSQAKGIVLWNHGQSRGKRPDWHHGAPPVIRLFADAGWNVLLVQRSESCKGNWTNQGADYVANLVAQVKEAKRAGYRRILAAGQSYGAAVALGAAGDTVDIEGVLSFALSHGRGSCRNLATFEPAMIEFHEYHIKRAIERSRAHRVLISLGEGDHCVGHSFTPTVSSALAAKGIPHIYLDEQMAIAGHGAARTKAFRDIYGACIVEFFARISAPPGRHRCD